MNGKPEDMDWVWAFLIALATIILVHQPGLSLQSLLVPPRALSFAQMAMIKLVVGLTHSLIIIGFCAALMRRASRRMIWAAVITQIVYLEVEWGFSLGAADVGEAMVRFGEQAGVILSLLLAFTAIRVWPKSKPT